MSYFWLILVINNIQYLAYYLLYEIKILIRVKAKNRLYSLWDYLKYSFSLFLEIFIYKTVFWLFIIAVQLLHTFICTWNVHNRYPL